jgi:hypothetical protein
MNNKVLIHISLISVLHCKERLTMLNGELSDHRARPKNIPVALDVVTEDLGENSPVLQMPVKRLVMRPDAALHLEVLDGVDVVLGALDLVHVPAVAAVGLDTFVWLEEVRQTGGEDLDVGPRPGRVRALDPHQVAHQNVNAQLIVKGGLPRILVGPKWVALLCSPLLGDTEVRPSTNIRQSLPTLWMPRRLSKSICGLGERRCNK